MKIIHFITELSMGGAQMALYRLLTHLPDNIEAEVVCLYNGDGLAAQKLRAAGIAVTDLGMTSKVRFDAFLRLYRLLRQQQPDILHTWTFHANVSGRIVGTLARVPRIITSRRNVEIGGWRREQIKRWTTGLDDRIIAVCELARQMEIDRSRVPPEKVITVYNGIEAALYAGGDRRAVRVEYGIPPEAFVIGVVGRLHPQKGHLVLLKAVAHLQRQGLDPYLLLVGDGELRASLADLIQADGLVERVLVTGTRSDIPHVLAALDLFVLPSLWEGMPNVVLEAMAAGLPVVATAVGGTPEVVVDQVTGLLVPPNDAAALAQAIKSVQTDPELARQMGENGRIRVAAHFSLDKTVALTVTLYQSLLSSRS